MRLTCILSFIAAIVLGGVLFGTRGNLPLGVHVVFVMMVGAFIATAVGVIRRVVASQVEEHASAATHWSQRKGGGMKRHSVGHHARSGRGNTTG